MYNLTNQTAGFIFRQLQQISNNDSDSNLNGNSISSLLNGTSNQFDNGEIEGEERHHKYSAKEQFIWLLHGWLMWVCWGLMGFLMVWSNRYFKQHWRLNMIIHSICGTGLFIINLIFGLGAITYLDWKIKVSIHGILGSLLAILLPFAAIEGIISRMLLKRLRWKTNILLIIQDVHKYLSYFTVFISQLAIIGGTLTYNQWDVEGTLLAFIHCGFFYTVLITYELTFRFVHRKNTKFISHPNKMTVQEFEDRIKKGEQLVLMNHLVLDISRYKFSHPAGAFVIDKNVGRDISKFFDGGYTLENKAGVKPCNHSFQARMIVNSLAIGQLLVEEGYKQSKILQENKDQANEDVKIKDIILQIPKNGEKVCNVKISERIRINQNTESFILRADSVMPKVQYYYEGTDMIGKHYKLTSKKLPGIVRYYTICNSIRPMAYKNYVRVLEEAVEEGNYLDFNEEIFNQDQQQEVILTVKNYGRKGGLSKHLFKHAEKLQLKLEGPMGKGLAVQDHGVHIAFVAGTGVLIFLDLVAYIARKNIEYLKSLSDPDHDIVVEANQDKNQGLSSMKFILYASFQDQENSIGLEMCQYLDRLCKKHSLDNFEFHLRHSTGYTPKKKIVIADEESQKIMSSMNHRRWDSYFLDDVLERNSKHGKIQKLWVCGPPLMNEGFDVALENLGIKYNIDKSSIDIL
eukprot:403344262